MSFFVQSVASPFTSRVPDIRCVPTVIRQGRAALITSFGIFKFMVTYSLTEFLSAITLYSIDANLTDLQFLFIDIFLIVNFASFFGKTQAYEGKLATQPPMTSILSFTPLFSLALHMIMMIIFQASVFYGVRQFDWFTPYVRNETAPTDFTSYENYSVFCVSLFQYITMAVIYSRGKPYRRPVYTNKAFMGSIVGLIFVCTYITAFPANWTISLLKLKLPPNFEWSAIILLLAGVNFLICFFIEMGIIEYVIEGRIKPKLYRPAKSKKKYLGIQAELNNELNWPKINNDVPVLPLTPSSENILKSCENSREEKVLAGVENLGFVEDEKTSETTKF